MFIDVHWFSRIFNDFNDFHWFPMDFHGFSMIFNGFFKENCASVGQPWAPFGGLGRPWGAALGGLRPLGGGYSCLKTAVSRGASSKNRTSVPTRSAAFGPPRRPSPACGWELSVGTGLPPQTPPDFYSSNIQGWGCWCCLLLSHAGGVGGLHYITW